MSCFSTIPLKSVSEAVQDESFPLPSSSKNRPQRTRNRRRPFIPKAETDHSDLGAISFYKYNMESDFNVLGFHGNR